MGTLDTTRGSAALIVGSIYRTVWYTWQAGQYGITTMTHVVGSVSGPITQGGLAYGLLTAGATLLCDAMTEASHLLGALTYVLAPGSQPVPGICTATGFFGLSGSEPIPGQVSGIISTSTDTRGPLGRGRMFIPFPDQSSNDGGTNTPTDDYITELNNFAIAVLGATFTVTDQAAHTATIHTSLFNRGTGTARQLVSAEGRSYWATQKRRGDLGRVNPAFLPG